VKVNLYVADLLPGHLGQGNEQLRVVLLFGIEEAVAGLSSGGVAWGCIGNARPGLLPTSNSLYRGLHGGTSTKRLVVVHDGNPESPGFRPSEEVSGTIAEIRSKPEFSVTRKLHDESVAPVLLGFKELRTLHLSES
jgi:hypothetical protein